MEAQVQQQQVLALVLGQFRQHWFVHWPDDLPLWKLLCPVLAMLLDTDLSVTGCI
jgi:hypothetical protein